MPAPRKYPNELRERAQRLVAEAREQDQNLSLNAAVLRIGPRVGANPDTLRGWCKQAAIDAGQAPGTTTGDAARIKSSLGHVPPTEYEMTYYRQNTTAQQPLTGEPASAEPGAVHSWRPGCVQGSESLRASPVSHLAAGSGAV